MPELSLFSNPHLIGAIGISGLLQLSVVTLPFAQSAFEVTAHLSSECLLVFLLARTLVTLIEVGKLMQAVWRDRSCSQPQ